MHVLLFGGSFNPIHWGHIRLAQYALAQTSADELWLMVSPQNPLKPTEGMLPEETRARLAEEAVTDARIKVSRFEFSLPRPSYTYQTLRALRAERPADSFSLLIGADSYHDFSRWAQPEEILAHHSVYVYPREGFPLPAEGTEKGAAFRFLRSAPIFPFSSTQVRRLLLDAPEEARDVVPEAVWRALVKM